MCDCAHTIEHLYIRWTISFFSLTHPTKLSHFFMLNIKVFALVRLHRIVFVPQVELWRVEARKSSFAKSCHTIGILPPYAFNATLTHYPLLPTLTMPFPLSDRQTDKIRESLFKREEAKVWVVKKLSTLSLSLINASRNIPISHTHFRHLSLPSSLSLSLFLTHKHLLSLTSIFNFPLSNAYSLSHTLSLSVSHFQLANALKGMR